MITWEPLLNEQGPSQGELHAGKLMLATIFRLANLDEKRENSRGRVWRDRVEHAMLRL